MVCSIFSHRFSESVLLMHVLDSIQFGYVSRCWDSVLWSSPLTLFQTPSTLGLNILLVVLDTLSIAGDGVRIAQMHFVRDLIYLQQHYRRIETLRNLDFSTACKYHHWSHSMNTYRKVTALHRSCFLVSSWISAATMMKVWGRHPRWQALDLRQG